MDLRQFITTHSVDVPCTCAAGAKEGNISVGFFHVELKDAPADAGEQLKKLIAEHKGSFCDLNPLDGQPHRFEDLGGWLGDQGLALRLIGMGALLGLWVAHVGDVVALVPTELMRQLETEAAALTSGAAPASESGEPATDPAAATSEGTETK